MALHTWSKEYKFGADDGFQFSLRGAAVGYAQGLVRVSRCDVTGELYIDEIWLGADGPGQPFLHLTGRQADGWLNDVFATLASQMAAGRIMAEAIEDYKMDCHDEPELGRAA